MVTLRARVSNDDWMYFYPGIVYLDNVEIMDAENERQIPFITRMVVFEHENIGYYENGDYIEIRGLLQYIKNPPYEVITKFQRSLPIENQEFAQIVVGTKENYENEYVKNLRL